MHELKRAISDTFGVLLLSGGMLAPIILYWAGQPPVCERNGGAGPLCQHIGSPGIESGIALLGLWLLINWLWLTWKPFWRNKRPANEIEQHSNN